ncbi:MAG: hypothetical protein IJY44_06880 [Bacteroidaceae bacterium]|nr:hypothetical protein [Bacteroidaceae bacterium]
MKRLFIIILLTSVTAITHDLNAQHNDVVQGSMVLTTRDLKIETTTDTIKTELEILQSYYERLKIEFEKAKKELKNQQEWIEKVQKTNQELKKDNQELKKKNQELKKTIDELNNRKNKQSKTKKEKQSKTKKEKQSKTKELLPIKSGYQQTATISTMFTGKECLRYQIDYIGGYRINKNFFAGLGIGLNIQSHECKNSTITTYYAETGNVNHELFRPYVSIPLYAHLKAYVGKKRFLPFLALSAGVDIATPSKHKVHVTDSSGEPLYSITEIKTSSLFIEPMVGLDVRLSSQVSLNFQIGMNLHGVPWINFKDAAHIKIYKKAESDISFKLGCTF